MNHGGSENEGEDHRAIIECLNEIKQTIEPIINHIKSNQDSDRQQSKQPIPLRNSSQEYDPVTGQYQNRTSTSTFNVNLTPEWDLNQDFLNNLGSQPQSLGQFNGEFQSQSEFHNYSQIEPHIRNHSHDQKEEQRQSQEQDLNQALDPFFIHPLSFPTHQIKNSKLQLINSLKSIKHSIVKFHHSVLGPLISHLPALPEPILDQPHVTQTQFPKLFSLLRESSRGLNYLMNVKIESDIADQLINHHHSSISSLSPQFIINQSQSSSSSQSQTLHLIELLLRQHSLEFFREPDSNLLMIAGKVMVIDLELDPPTQIHHDSHNPQSDHDCNQISPNSTLHQDSHQSLNQKVKRCKFSYSFGDEESKRDEDLDKALLDSLKNIHQTNQPKIVLDSLKRFSNLLFQLKSIDELIFSQQSQESGVQPIDYFYQFRLLIKSYHTKFLEFLKLEHTDSASLQSFIDLELPPIDPGNLSPYGYPISSPSHFELTIIYHFTAARLLRFKSNELLKRPHQHFMKIKFTKPNKLNNYSIDSLFTVVFDPPILVSKPIALELNQITNPTLPKKKKSKLIESDENDLFLDDLLLMNQFKEEEEKENDEEEVEVRKGKEWEKKKRRKLKRQELMKEGKWRDDQFGYGSIPFMMFSCIKRNEGLEVKNHTGFSVNEVGFNDLNGLLKIIHISRRQTVLNELFQSCFNSRHYLNNDDEDNDEENESRRKVEKGLAKEEITLDELLSNQKPKSIPIEVLLIKTDYRF
ncbi:hypothetical protein DFH28DRAFT_227371 [Melampsora americana]|nr:hypothetical protein DFH28DRAFT_227371 [Melampsora americana]